MKCFVCAKEYSGHVCPRCKFPDARVPEADREEARKQLSPFIEKHRASFLKCIRAEIVLTYWKDQNGWVVPDREESLFLGTGTDIYQKEHWLDQQLSRLPDIPGVPIHLRVSIDGSVQDLEVEVPNLHVPQRHQIGAFLDEEFRIQLMLRNGIEPTTSSAPIPL